MTPTRRVLLLAGVLAFGCGDPQDAPPPAAPDLDALVDNQDAGADSATGPIAPAPWNEVDFNPQAPTLPRLTASQYAKSVRTLFGESVVVPPPPEPDVEVGGFVAIGAAVSTISPRGVENFEVAAYTVAAQLTAEAARARVVQCAPAGVDDGECMAEVVRSQGRRIWRRPLTEEEVARVAAVGLTAATTLDNFYGGVEFALAALLQSPHFLFRREVGTPDPETPDIRRYTGYDLAARLSFMLLDTTPDDALLDAAEAGELDTEAGLRTAATRLLADPRAREGMARFFTEWLHLDGLDALHKDPLIYPAMSADLGQMARTETLLTLDDLVFERDADFRDVLTQRRTFVNRKLASMYAVRAPTREGFAPVELPAHGLRRGLLGQTSILAGNAHPTSTSSPSANLARAAISTAGPRAAASSTVRRAPETPHTT